jgi:hypothetical protein
MTVASRLIATLRIAPGNFVARSPLMPTQGGTDRIRPFPAPGRVCGACLARRAVWHGRADVQDLRVAAHIVSISRVSVTCQSKGL